MTKIFRDAVQIVIKEVAKGTGKELATTVRDKIKKMREKANKEEGESE